MSYLYLFLILYLTQEIDEALSIARDKGYRAVLQLGSKATNALLNTAIKVHLTNNLILLLA